MRIRFAARDARKKERMAKAQAIYREKHGELKLPQELLDAIRTGLRERYKSQMEARKKARGTTDYRSRFL